jgi:hypothetical protein
MPAAGDHSVQLLPARHQPLLQAALLLLLLLLLLACVLLHPHMVMLHGWGLAAA